MTEKIKVKVEYDFDEVRGGYIANIYLYSILPKNDLLSLLPREGYFDIPLMETSETTEIEIGKRVYKGSLERYPSFFKFRQDVQKIILEMFKNNRHSTKIPPDLKDVYYFLV